jgi:predicted oxidoreductase (fatty acid repression mutant protein)
VIADLKPYQEYRQSALAWSVDIPSHWQVHEQKPSSNVCKDPFGLATKL